MDDISSNSENPGNCLMILRQIALSELIEEITKAKISSIMADEVITYDEEMLSIFFRYVDKNKEIREAFLEFIDLERITRSGIGNTILTFFDKKGIDIKNVRDQCYDGAPNMQAVKVGASSVILEKSPKLRYSLLLS